LTFHKYLCILKNGLADTKERFSVSGGAWIYGVVAESWHRGLVANPLSADLLLEFATQTPRLGTSLVSGVIAALR
jgi:hypothetical protein